MKQERLSTKNLFISCCVLTDKEILFNLQLFRRALACWPDGALLVRAELKTVDAPFSLPFPFLWWEREGASSLTSWLGRGTHTSITHWMRMGRVFVFYFPVYSLQHSAVASGELVYLTVYLMRAPDQAMKCLWSRRALMVIDRRWCFRALSRRTSAFNASQNVLLETRALSISLLWYTFPPLVEHWSRQPRERCCRIRAQVV